MFEGLVTQMVTQGPVTLVVTGFFHVSSYYIRLTPRRMPAKHKRGMVYPAITALWLGFHKFDPLFKIVYKVLIIKVFRPILIAPSKQGRSTYQIIDVVH